MNRKQNKSQKYFGLINIIISICFITITGCSKQEEEQVYASIIYPVGGLGDHSYVDNIFKGAIEAKYELGIIPEHFFPESQNEAREIFDSLVRLKQNQNSIILLADETYSGFLNTDEYDNISSNILLLDGASKKNIWTINISFYGAAYLAGIAAKQISKFDTVAFIAGMPLPALDVCYLGFSDGFLRSGGKYVERYYLDSTINGFNNIAKAEQLTEMLSKKTNLFVAAAGGSNMGIFKYIREHQNNFAIGIDSDQSAFAVNGIIGSIIKKTDTAVYNSLKDFKTSGYYPRKDLFGLESEYTDFTINPVFSNLLDDLIKEKKLEALIKEKEFLLNNPE